MRKKYSFLIVLVFLALLVPAVYAQDKNVQDAAYWRTEGDKHVAVKRYDDAIECYKKSFAMDPLYARTAYRIAFAYDVQRKFGESPPYLDRAMELVTSGKDTSKLPISDIYAEKGFILIQTGKPKEALPLYDLAIKGDPKWAYPVFWKAFAYYKLRDYDRALELCNKVLQMEKDHTDALRLKAVIEKQISGPSSSSGE